MKCIKCRDKCDYSCECVVVSCAADKQKSQNIEGIIDAGVCDDCVKTQIKIEKYSQFGKPFKFLAIPPVIGLILLLIGIFAEINILPTVGGILFIAGIIVLLIYNFISTFKIKKNPHRVLHTLLQGQGDILLVPVGENFYKDEAEFRRVNKHLLPDTSEKLYSEYIVTGKWKELPKVDESAIKKDDGLSKAVDEYIKRSREATKNKKG